MAKAPKAPSVQVTADVIDKAARTSVVRDLVQLAEAFNRAGAHGPFSIVLPLFCAVSVKDKGYRRHNVPENVRVNTGKIHIGKRDGLIFSFPIEGEWNCDKGPVEWIELSWDDVINSFDGLADRIEGYLPDANKTVKQIDEACRGAIKSNEAMHKILNEGFLVAQQHKREHAQQDVLEDHPLFGTFG